MWGEDELKAYVQMITHCIELEETFNKYLLDQLIVRDLTCIINRNEGQECWRDRMIEVFRNKAV